MTDATTLATSFCETLDERAAGQVPVHSPTIPHSVFLSGYNFTIAPGDLPLLTKEQVEAAASTPNRTAHSAIFAERHTNYGLPTAGELVWVVDITPSGIVYLPFHPDQVRQAIKYEYAVLDATTGKGVAVSVGEAPPDVGTPDPSGQLEICPPTLAPGTPASPALLPSPKCGGRAATGWRQ